MELCYICRQPISSPLICGSISKKNTKPARTFEHAVGHLNIASGNNHYCLNEGGVGLEEGVTLSMSRGRMSCRATVSDMNEIAFYTQEVSTGEEFRFFHSPLLRTNIKSGYRPEQ
jgi:hypothetical protein